jgi:hypothetical protein
LIFGQAGVGEQIRHRCFDGRQRRAQRVRDGIKERGAQPLAFAGGFGLAELLDGASTLHRDGDESADGFERLARKDCA